MPRLKRRVKYFCNIVYLFQSLKAVQQCYAVCRILNRGHATTDQLRKYSFKTRKRNKKAVYMVLIKLVCSSRQAQYIHI